MQLCLFGCASSDHFDTSTAEGAYKLGEKYHKDERFEEAIVQFNSVKNKFPYSRLATEAELQVANIQYQREFYLEAQSAYQVFKEMHPKHARSDYVTFRLAMSFFHQLPSSVDRDLQLATRAILYFDEVLRSFPGSEHQGEALEYRGKTRKMLADKEFYVGNFYFVRKMYDSALNRFDKLIQNYPDEAPMEEILYSAGVSALRLKSPNKAKEYLKILKAKYPKSSATDRLESEIGTWSGIQTRKRQTC